MGKVEEVRSLPTQTVAILLEKVLPALVAALLASRAAVSLAAVKEDQQCSVCSQTISH